MESTHGSNAGQAWLTDDERPELGSYCADQPGARSEEEPPDSRRSIRFPYH
jgi:hypothetical protein